MNAGMRFAGRVAGSSAAWILAGWLLLVILGCDIAKLTGEKGEQACGKVEQRTHGTHVTFMLDKAKARVVSKVQDTVYLDTVFKCWTK